VIFLPFSSLKGDASYFIQARCHVGTPVPASPTRACAGSGGNRETEQAAETE